MTADRLSQEAIARALGDIPDDAQDDALLQDQASGKPPSQADLLVALALQRYELGISTDGQPFALKKHGLRVAHLLRHAASSLRSELAAEFYEKYRTAASTSALATTMQTLEGFARRMDETELHLRIARRADGSIWIDRGDPSGEAIHVTAAGWSLESSAPTVFRRSDATGVLPRPVPGGDPMLLGQLINATPSQLRLMIAWLVAALFPNIPHAILALKGIQGSGKSEAERVLVRLMDPGPAPLRTAPRDITDWVVAASGSYVVGLDNVSSIQAWFSDALCRAATGEGLIRRKLYSDSELAIISFRRVILFNGIDFGAIRGDLADRCVFIELLPIGPNRRRTDADLEQFFIENMDSILGGLLDLLVRVIQVLPSVELTTMPRMADFAMVLAAVDRVNGWDTLAMFESGQEDQQAEVLEADEVATAVVAFMDGLHDRWTGTATELLESLSSDDGHSKFWPATPSALSGRLRRAIPALRSAGIRVDFNRDSGAQRRRLIHMESLGNERPERSKLDGVDGLDGEILTPRFGSINLKEGEIADELSNPSVSQ